MSVTHIYIWFDWTPAFVWEANSVQLLVRALKSFYNSYRSLLYPFCNLFVCSLLYPFVICIIYWSSLRQCCGVGMTELRLWLLYFCTISDADCIKNWLRFSEAGSSKDGRHLPDLKSTALTCIIYKVHCFSWYRHWCSLFCYNILLQFCGKLSLLQ